MWWIRNEMINQDFLKDFVGSCMLNVPFAQRFLSENPETDLLQQRRCPQEEGSKGSFRGSTALLFELEDKVAQAAASVQNAQSEVMKIRLSWSVDGKSWSLPVLSSGLLHREQDRCPERCRDPGGQKKGKDNLSLFIWRVEVISTVRAVERAASDGDEDDASFTIWVWWILLPSEVQKKPDWALSHFLCFIVCFFLQSAIPIHARRLSHNPPTSKKPHTDPDDLSFTDFNLIRLRSRVSGGKQPRFVAQLLHLRVRCAPPCRIPAGRLFYKWKAVPKTGLRWVRPKIQDCWCQWEFNTIGSISCGTHSSTKNTERAF